MKVFVTGGSGFVGQNIIPVFLDQGFKVFALVRSEKSADVVAKLGAIPVYDDLTSLSDNTAQALNQCDVVVHSAAYMDFTYDPRPYYQINVDATKDLLIMAKQNGISKFIYVSAAPVIPGSPIINMTEDGASTGLPSDLYPKTKAIAEKAVLQANTEGFKTIALRPPAIWGPNNHHFEDLMANVANGKWKWVGGGHQILSTIHVKNLANAILCALRSESGGEAYFVTDGDRRSMRKTFTAIIKSKGLNPGDKELPRGVAVFMAHLLGGIWKTFKIKSRPPIAPLMIRLMATEFSVSDQKARKELGYKNVITFEEGVKSL